MGPKIQIRPNLLLSKNATALVLLICCMALFLISTFKHKLLGVHFFYDADTIAQYITNHPRFTTEDSFESTAAIYATIGLTSNRELVSFMQMGILVLIIWREILLLNAKLIKPSAFIAIFFLAFFSSIYLTDLSKDFWVLLLAAFLPRKIGYKLIIWIAISLLYALFFRKYWFIIIGIFLLTMYATKFKHNVLRYLFLIAFVSLSLSLIFQHFLGIDLHTFRSTVNDSRIEGGIEDARTMISIPFESSNSGFSAINMLLIWLTLAVPIPLLLLASPYYTTLFAIILFIFATTIRNAQIVSYANDRQWRKQLLLPCSLILAFTLSQAIFEPDYGSYIRHLSALLPVFIRVLGMQPHSTS